MIPKLTIGLLLITTLTACSPASSSLTSEEVDARISTAIARIPTVTPVPQQIQQAIVFPSPLPTSTPQPTATPFTFPTAQPFSSNPTTTNSKPLTIDAPTLYKRFVDSIAVVETAQGKGTGFYIGDGLIVTAFHVVSDSTSLTTGNVSVGLNQSKSFDRATVLGYNRARDIAVLKMTSSPSLQKLEFRKLGDTGAGSTIYIIGFPLQTVGSPLITEGVIARTYQKFGSLDQAPIGLVIEYDTSTAPGVSGAPVISEDGYVIGIHQVARASSGVATDYKHGISSDEVLSVLEDLKSGKKN